MKVIKEVSEYQDEVRFADGNVPFKEISELVLEANGWGEKGTFTRKRKDELVFRRGIVDLIATCNGCTISECARCTDRDHTTVIKSLRSIEDRLDTDMYARKILRETMQYIRENFQK